MTHEEIPALNGDMTTRVVVDTDQIPWTPSPSGAVLRKRLHLVGEAESGQVTSLVRYPPGSAFPEHDHPEGEEIFVLEGTFSDQLGDAVAGTHLLNPEGFRHNPSSEDGCLIFVKLRQYDGRDRPYRRVQSRDLPWEETDRPGVMRKTLFEEPTFPDVTRLERWRACEVSGLRSFPDGAEILLLEGSFSDSEGQYGPGTWLRLPVGAALDAHTDSGCTLYIKSGALPHLRSATSSPTQMTET